MDQLPAEPTGPKVVVVGAGIIGLTSALYLAQAGYSVSVIERATGPCQGASHANAGQLIYDRIGVMASPEFLAGLRGTLFDREQGVRVSGLAHPARWRWTAAFLRQCTTRSWQRNTEQMLEIAQRSRRAMTETTNLYSLDFDWRKPGKLRLYSSQGNLAAANRSAEFQGRFGGAHKVLNAAECVALEPALDDTRRDFIGGLHLPNAEVGDCQKFGQALASILVNQLDVQITFGVDIRGLVRRAGRVRAIKTTAGETEAELFVLATGGATSHLLRGGFPGRRPITGIKGMTLTFPASDTAPDVSVTDTAGKFVVLRLGDRVRVAGYAMFSDDLNLSHDYVQRLIDKAQVLMPQAALFDQAPDICVQSRPTTPDDLPMIGRADADNLFVNAGHGSLGWTLALGSAEMLVQAILDAAHLTSSQVI